MAKNRKFAALYQCIRMKRVFCIYESPRSQLVSWQYGEGILAVSVLDPGALSENEEYDEEEI